MKMRGGDTGVGLDVLAKAGDGEEGDRQVWCEYGDEGECMVRVNSNGEVMTSSHYCGLCWEW